MAVLQKRTTASISCPAVAKPSTPNVPSGASGMGSSDETSTSRINELEGRDGLERNGSVRLLAASSTIRLLRLVTDNGNGLYPAGRWKSCWNIRNAPGLAPRHA